MDVGVNETVREISTLLEDFPSLKPTLGVESSEIRGSDVGHPLSLTRIIPPSIGIRVPPKCHPLCLVILAPAGVWGTGRVKGLHIM